MARIISVFVGVPRNAVRAVSSAQVQAGGAAAAEAGPPASTTAPAAGGALTVSSSSSCGHHSAAYGDAGRLLVCLDGRHHTQLHIHLAEPGPLQHAVSRPTYRSGSQARHWVLPFLFGSGVTALGLAAYTSACQECVMQTRPLGLSGEAAPRRGGSHLWNPSHWWRSRAESRELVPSYAGDQPAPVPPASFPIPLACRSAHAAVGRPFSDEARASPLTRTSITQASERASPSVVHLIVTQEAQLGSAHGHKSSGSGFIYDSDGYILTNAHVVQGAGESGNMLAVTLQDGCVYRGSVIKVDKTADVAVVKVDSPGPLPAAKIGLSSQLSVGEWVVALGSPLMLKHSVTAGIISCVERKGSELGLAAARHGYIQTDASVNQGNSGGPLINLDGEVIGINNMKAVAADGVSFAIPIDTVQDIVRQLSVHGRVIRPFIGITMLEVANGGLTQLKQQVPGLTLTQQAVVVQRVVPGSPAEEAGLQEEDIMLTVAGEEGLTMAQMVACFTAHIGKPIELRLMRKAEDGSYSTLTKSITPMEMHAPR